MGKRPMHLSSILRWVVLVSVACSFLAPGLGAQTGPPRAEVPLEHCDKLPVVKLKIGGAEVRFLVDTAATSMLNIKSVSAGRPKKVQITSWTGTSVTTGREVFVHDLQLGNHTIYNFKMSAVDLTPIATACGGPIDGILGVDLLEKLGVTIDLQRGVARMDSPKAVSPRLPSENAVISEMGSAMEDCWNAFNNAEGPKLVQCFDPDFVMGMPSVEYHGRERAVEYFKNRYFNGGPRAHLEMKLSDQRAVGNVVWSLYDFSIESRDIHESGRGMMICRKAGEHWYIVSMHDVSSRDEAVAAQARQ